MQPVDATPFFKRGVLLASSHPMEENLFLNCLDRLGIFLMIAPRHPERFSEVEELLRAKNIPFFCSNKLTSNHFGESSVEEKILQKGVRVLLINEIGKLPTFYRAAACTIVGGSLFPGVGGHNLIEPLLYGSFPLFGPYIDKQLHLKALLSEWNLFRDCTPENLQDRVLEFLDNPTLRSELEQSLKRARAFMDKPLALTLDRLRDLSQLE
jgi:3-deoxy-D-manno-octulosonic-acid transferase